MIANPTSVPSPTVEFVLNDAEVVIPLTLRVVNDPFAGRDAAGRLVRALPSIAGNVPVSCPAGIFVSPEPEPENDVAVTTPATRIPPGPIVVIPATLSSSPMVTSVLIATSTALIFKLFGESIVGVPAETLSNLVAVTIPLNLPSPSTVNAELDKVVPMPTFFVV